MTKQYFQNKYKQIQAGNIAGSRKDLAQDFEALGFKLGVEIGVERGLYAKQLCRLNPGLKLLAIDPWRAYSGYREHVPQEKMDWLYGEAQKRLAPYDCILVRQTSQEAVVDFTDGSLDFVYIDGNHEFQNVVNDICEWAKKVKPGGIVAGHDFRRYKNYIHVIEAVRGYTDAYGLELFIMNNDQSPTWFFIKK